MTFTGTFQITDWQEQVEQLLDDGAKLSVATVQQTYTGAIEGSSTVRYQLYYHKNGNAVFHGFETIHVIDNNQPHTLVIKHDGQFENGIASSVFTVIDSYNNQTLLGKTGRFTSMAGGKAAYEIL